MKATTRNIPTRTGPDLEKGEPEQPDRVTLIAFYLFMGSILAGLLYLLVVLLFS